MSNNKQYNYNVQKAASKLLWRFNSVNGQTKSFNPNKDDIQSLNTLLECVNREKKEKLSQNVLFAKLFIYALTDHLRKFETTIFDKEITKQLSMMLEKPLDVFYKAFEEDLYNNQTKRIELKDGVTIDDFKRTYTTEFIQMNLDLMITEALNRFED
tara:strand:+ start:33088 stop:33555 length:468 start_codon:yes stop_codon:yes gene_type:complete